MNQKTLIDADILRDRLLTAVSTNADVLNIARTGNISSTKYGSKKHCQAYISIDLDVVRAFMKAGNFNGFAYCRDVIDTYHI